MTVKERSEISVILNAWLTGDQDARTRTQALLSALSNTARKPKRMAAKNPADMSNAELFAYYHANAHIEDTRFFAMNAYMSVNLRAKAEGLLAQAEAGLSRAQTLAQLVELQDAWRRESNAWERRDRVLQNIAESQASRANCHFVWGRATAQQLKDLFTPLQQEWQRRRSLDREVAAERAA